MHDWSVLEEAGELTRRGAPFALATVVWRQGPSSGQQGARAIITPARLDRRGVRRAGSDPGSP
jgi:XdhC and CoxI family